MVASLIKLFPMHTQPQRPGLVEGRLARYAPLTCALKSARRITRVVRVRV